MGSVLLAGAVLLAAGASQAAELGGLYPSSHVALPGDVTNAVAAEALARSAGDAGLLASNAQAMAAAVVAATNLQAAIDAESLARAAGDAVGLTNWQAVAYSLTNGAALGATALQPAATNDLAEAAAHATAHGVTQYGGFQGGDGANCTEAGGAVGSGANTTAGGAVGYGANTTDGGAVGYGANTTDGGAVGANAYATDGGAVGYAAQTTDGGAVGYAAQTTDGGAVGRSAKTSDGFAGGKNAFATTDGNRDTDGIDAIQLGTGGNTEPFSLQIYSHKLMHADGNIPMERLGYHNTNTASHADIRAQVAAIPTNVVSGWLVWDSGSNVFWRVSATNLRFYVWP